MYLSWRRIEQMGWVIIFAKIISAFVLVYLGIAVGLILSQWPIDKITGAGLDFERLNAQKSLQAVETQSYVARDGARMAVRVHEGVGPLVVLIHGSGAFGAAYDWMAAEVAARGARVLVPDLRGHGAAADPRGDIAYIGQFEDDLADFIAAFRKPEEQLILAGHSSGGGLVIRYAGGAYGHDLDGAILLAPFLHHAAPTMRENAGGWTRVLVRRTIGLVMLNTVGIEFFNGLTIVQFNLPEGSQAENMTGAYSFRLNTSYAPRSAYLDDVAGLPPFLLVVGRDDEAFQADAFEPTMLGATDRGQYHILDGVSHLDVFLQDRTVDLIDGFLDGMR
jgi:pimeloyl-ACP methyl ester carboxylesterase